MTQIKCLMLQEGKLRNEPLEIENYTLKFNSIPFLNKNLKPLYELQDCGGL